MMIYDTIRYDRIPILGSITSPSYLEEIRGGGGLKRVIRVRFELSVLVV
jgi:hypothetical protein